MHVLVTCVHVRVMGGVCGCVGERRARVVAAGAREEVRVARGVGDGGGRRLVRIRTRGGVRAVPRPRARWGVCVRVCVCVRVHWRVSIRFGGRFVLSLSRSEHSRAMAAYATAGGRRGAARTRAVE